MMLVILSIACFIVSLWVIMSIVRTIASFVGLSS